MNKKICMIFLISILVTGLAGAENVAITNTDTSATGNADASVSASAEAVISSEPTENGATAITNTDSSISGNEVSSSASAYATITLTNPSSSPLTAWATTWANALITINGLNIASAIAEAIAYATAGPGETVSSEATAMVSVNVIVSDPSSVNAESQAGAIVGTGNPPFLNRNTNSNNNQKKEIKQEGPGIFFTFGKCDIERYIWFRAQWKNSSFRNYLIEKYNITTNIDGLSTNEYLSARALYWMEYIAIWIYHTDSLTEFEATYLNSRNGYNHIGNGNGNGNYSWIENNTIRTNTGCILPSE